MTDVRTWCSVAFQVVIRPLISKNDYRMVKVPRDCPFSLEAELKVDGTAAQARKNLICFEKLLFGGPL